MSGNEILVIAIIVGLFVGFAGLLVYATEHAGGDGWDKSPK